MRMPFGKYRGEYVDELPVDYLTWLFENVELRGGLAQAVRDALSEQSRDADMVLNEGALVHRIYRGLCRRWHPDCGGSNDAMKAVNDFYEKLMAHSTGNLA
jgi:hypothetical protein